MAKWRAANLLLLAALALLLRTRGASIEVENDAQEEKELHLSRIKDAYSFLEASLNALEVNTPHSLDEADPKKLSQKQLGYAHHEMLKKLKLQKLNNITNIRNVIIRCVSDSIQHAMGALVSILQEVLSYNEFCTSLDEHFSYLYETNVTFKQIIKSCSTSTEIELRENYLSLYVEDFKLILQVLKNPNITFRDFDDISKCFVEFYKSFITPFQAYVPRTSLYMEFIKTHKNFNDYYSEAEIVREFLKTYLTGMSTEQITLFFDNLFNIYTRSFSYGRCLYHQK
ncbi:hypothetical protein, conserved [Plasmodium vivax]|uniref:Uncharacterized protein n=1 Tax=Plasmodium vivax (strain Salvador I) TaxID=126793 RepID=A5K7R8_PLAVS|nr:hypothetical protein, conserved [Plasmodium vivax]EDL44827.1 hypothetical protein, conserved [Plasmodium vivax]|eukprot:XP_001614554.1 hypothetical protein [Plasmodium vivax Sal-1]